MLIEFENLGFKNSVNKTWFCPTPINNEPCGICHPCRTIVEEGMSFRLTQKGLHRNKFAVYYKAKELIKNENRRVLIKNLLNDKERINRIKYIITNRFK